MKHSVKDILSYVKSKLSPLDDYSQGEEYLLLEGTLNLAREKLFLEGEISTYDKFKIKKVLRSRFKGKPLSKIFKRQNFYGYDFYVDTHVFCPRKETEILVEKVLNYAKNFKGKSLKILDLGCGSGCIGLTLAKNLDADITLCDVSLPAVNIAKKNARKLKVRSKVKIFRSDMFKRVKGKFDIVVCNPPYIGSFEFESLPKGVRLFDPKISTCSGEDSLKFYKILAKDGTSFLGIPGLIAVEIGYDERAKVKRIFENAGFIVKCFKDYSRNDRVILAFRNK